MSFQASDADAKAWSSERITGLNGPDLRQKSYLRDNRVVTGKSTYRPGGLLPRCRFPPSCPCRSGQG